MCIDGAVMVWFGLVVVAEAISSAPVVSGDVYGTGQDRTGQDRVM